MEQVFSKTEQLSKRLYVGKCRRCGFWLHSSSTERLDLFGQVITIDTGITTLQTDMAKHLNKSHKEDIDLPLHVSMKDYEAWFSITTFTNTAEDPNAVQMILATITNRGFKIATRKHPKLGDSLFSGLGNGEFKLFLKSERD